MYLELAACVDLAFFRKVPASFEDVALETTPHIRCRMHGSGQNEAIGMLDRLPEQGHLVRHPRVKQVRVW